MIIRALKFSPFLLAVLCWTGCFASTSADNSRTAYGAPDAPVMATTTGRMLIRRIVARA